MYPDVSEWRVASLEDRAGHSSEMAVGTNQTVRRYIPEGNAFAFSF
jgi:hypothetical protein